MDVKGFGFHETVRRWSESEREWQGDRGGPFGKSGSQTEYFYTLAAQLGLERAEYYACVEGCCTVIWSNGHIDGGNGPAGCLCQLLKDPRGSEINA